MPNFKHLYLALFCFFSLGANLPSFTQTVTFEEFKVPTNGVMSGSDLAGGFAVPQAFFPNQYTTGAFSYWSGGWAISSKTDSLIAGFDNLFSARPGKGVNGSKSYAVGQQASIIKATTFRKTDLFNELYITNTTYAYFSMKNGDDFAKKFGGTSGNDPDFFRLTIKGYKKGKLTADSVNFYLADFRFTDNTKDYIVKDWTKVDLRSLQSPDSLYFTLASSDVGAFGINTPLFFAIDDVAVSKDLVATRDIIDQQGLEVYPNPFSETLNIRWADQENHFGVWKLMDSTGKTVWEEKANTPTATQHFNHLPNGVYWLQWYNGDKTSAKKIIKTDSK
jgi:Domain of unknown function (DUF4465)/Secretion system C-terminal sorting domain